MSNGQPSSASLNFSDFKTMDCKDNEEIGSVSNIIYWDQDTKEALDFIENDNIDDIENNKNTINYDNCYETNKIDSPVKEDSNSSPHSNIDVNTQISTTCHLEAYIYTDPISISESLKLKSGNIGAGEDSSQHSNSSDDNGSYSFGKSVGDNINGAEKENVERTIKRKNASVEDYRLTKFFLRGISFVYIYSILLETNFTCDAYLTRTALLFVI